MGDGDGGGGGGGDGDGGGGGGYASGVAEVAVDPSRRRRIEEGWKLGGQMDTRIHGGD